MPENNAGTIEENRSGRFGEEKNLQPVLVVAG
jgi:hypothetical protein